MNEKLALTVEQGQLLLVISSGFSLPEKLGTDSYTIADRAVAGDEVRKLYRELKSRSPLTSFPQRWQRFGPVFDGEVEIWHEVKGESGMVGHRLVNPDFEVSINTDSDIVSGIVWCLILGVHPASPSAQSLSHQETVLWPIAERIKMTSVIRQTIGLNDQKAKSRRWKTDDEFLKSKE